MADESPEKIINLKIFPLYEKDDIKGTKTNRIVQLSAQPIFYNERNCTVLAFQDITSLRKLALLEVQQESYQMRQSVVSHELATPLKCIISFSEDLKSELTDNPK